MGSLLLFPLLFILTILYQFIFTFISDIRDEIIDPDDGNTLHELLHHDSSIIEVRGKYNHTLLHGAARYNNTSCTRVLLRFAPHHLEAVNDKFNNTPLLLAVTNDNRDAAKMLLRAGADVRPKSMFDGTVFDYACDNEEMLAILNQHQQVSGIF